MSSCFFRRGASLLHRIYALLERLQPLWLLAARCYVARIFFTSGLTKIDDFETTVALFQYEYAVPVISPYLAALSGTAFELICPVLLVLGLFARGAALPLLVMTAVIQFTYLQHEQHYMWALLLAAVTVFGAGAWSADAFIKRRFNKSLSDAS